MKNDKKTSLLFIGSLLIMLVGSLLLSSCETSRVGPELPAPNPPAPPAQPLILKGTVADSKTGSVVSGATVQVLKQDGTTVTTIATDATGSFAYDVTTLNQSVLKVTATATGYGFAFVYANVDLVNKAAQIVSIPLDKIQTTTVNIAPTGGTITPPPSNESTSGQSVTITIPPNAVTQNTAITAAQISVNNVPPPINAATTTQVGVTNLQPAGITFAQPVRISFPLPYEFGSGELIPIQELVNNNWVTSTLTAVVDNTGLTANVNVTRTAQYSLIDNTSVSGTFGNIVPNDINSDSHLLYKVLVDRQYTFSSGTLNVTDLDGSNVFTVTELKKGTTGLPNRGWWINILKQKYPNDKLVGFTGASATTTFPVDFNIPWPGISPKAATADGGGNVDYPGQSGSWSVRVTISSFSVTNTNVSLENNRWKITVTAVTNSWQITQKEWIWTGHNQGAVSYPF